MAKAIKFRSAKFHLVEKSDKEGYIFWVLEDRTKKCILSKLNEGDKKDGNKMKRAHKISCRKF